MQIHVFVWVCACMFYRAIRKYSMLLKWSTWDFWMQDNEKCGTLSRESASMIGEECTRQFFNKNVSYIAGNCPSNALQRYH